jgi:CopA family copper-resistance protein
MGSSRFLCERAMDRRVSRRTFVKGLGVAGVGISAGVWGMPAFARGGNAATSWKEIAGTDFDLRIGDTPMNFTGTPRVAFTVNGSVPAPTLRWKEGDTVTLRVANSLDETASIHWHGIVLPANMDGVPGLSFHGIGPGETYVYRFKVRQGGTYWYHSHSGFQEQLGLYGPLIIDPLAPAPFKYDREHIVMLTDWTDESPERVFAKLKKRSDYYNFGQRTVGDFLRDVRTRGLKPTFADRKMWGEMRMNPTDLADVSGYTYTYLMNGMPPAANWSGMFTPGERVRLRFINGSAMSYFDVRIPGLKMTVVAADGQYVHPVTVDEFRIATAETYDVIVEPSGQDAFTIFAQSNDRTGFAAGTLAVREGLRAPVPALDPRPMLTMADMGHGGMDHGPGMTWVQRRIRPRLPRHSRPTRTPVTALLQSHRPRIRMPDMAPRRNQPRLILTRVTRCRRSRHHRIHMPATRCQAATPVCSSILRVRTVTRWSICRR